MKTVQIHVPDRMPVAPLTRALRRAAQETGLQLSYSTRKGFQLSAPATATAATPSRNTEEEE